ncbi:MAG: HAMP domain-containing histidine kinase, partial [Bacteroidales bacterium]|nr:HAMP domain-containing histidine kinase [Bacteroidales bacterium]
SFLSISVLVLILAFVVYARYRSKQKTNIILNRKNTEIENANAELNQKNKQITKQKNRLSGTLKELRETQKMLTDTSHRAGMAEIATGILHNVGNVLNSVKVSSQVLMEKIKSSKVNNLTKVLAMVEEHSKDIGTYITSDEKGKMLPEYLVKLGTTLKDEQDNSLNELSNLHKGINHIEEIIAVQQSYTGVSGLVEKVAISDMMDDVLKMHTEMFQKYKIKITKKYSKTKPILIEKGKLIQVFVNLLKNAKESLETKDEKSRNITIDISEDKQHQTIEITDNGEGISKENLTKIFSYGFTTKKDGKGFGLHTSALAMVELKGKLSVKSKGEGKGAKFVVNLPIKET